MKLKITLVLAFLTTFLQLSAQEYRISNGSASTCSGVFTDSGGTANNYEVNESQTFTICPSFPNNRVQVNFSMFDLAAGDILIVYDGNNTSDPFIGSYGSFLAPTIIEASATNSSGCLTFVFTSNPNSPTATGWEAQINCATDCQTISSTTTTIPAASADGIIRLCQGDTVSITGSSSFTVDGSNSTSRFEVSDGRESSGSTADFIFNDEGIYRVDYVVTDNTGCRDRTLEDVLIYVSTTPDFSGLMASPAIIAPGETSMLSGRAMASEYQNPMGLFTAGETFLPDGSGVSYTTCIDVFGLNVPSTLTASDLVRVYINIEHSYLGDLDIFLTSPTGQQIFLYEQTGSGTYLGIPIDNNNTNAPGTGFPYYFTEQRSATQTWSQASIGQATIPAGDYLPSEPFSLLDGSDINGTWCLTVVDNLPKDNGYIFEWGLQFKASLYPDLETFTPQEVSQSWLPDPDVINSNASGTEITVMPSDLGQNCYDYEFVDSFGCTYIDQVCVKVCDVSIVPTAIDDLEICADPYSSFTINLSLNERNLRQPSPDIITIEDYFVSLSDAQSNINPIGNDLILSDTNPSQTIFVRFLVDGTCPVIRPYNVRITQDFTLNAPVDISSPDFDGDQVATFDLSINSNINLNDPLPFQSIIRYYTSQNDAIANTNRIGRFFDYQNTSNPQTIFMTVERYGACRKIESFEISIADNTTVDTDGDGVNNFLEDLNNNGDLTDDDTDNDQIPNYLDTDDDGDTVPTAIEIIGTGAGTTTNNYTYIDTDNDLTENYLDDDDDGDGLDTIDEDYNLDGNPLNDDTNNNQIPDFLDDTVTLSVSTIENSGMEIYPTLFKDRITIKFNGSTHQNLQVTIVDLAGKQIISTQLENSRSEKSIDLSTLKQGMYLLLFDNGSGQKGVRKIVKR